MVDISTPNVLAALAVTLAAGLATGLGSLLVIFARGPNPRLLAFGLAFAGGAMVYVSLSEILNKSIASFTLAYDARTGFALATFAFLAGMVVGRSDFSLRAASDALPMRDAFAVLFFVSVGLLLEPEYLLAAPWLVAATLGIILIGKPLAALIIVVAMGYPLKVAFGVAMVLAQIGEFSFILASVGLQLGVLTPEANNTIVAASIISISINPLLYRAADPMAAWLLRMSDSQTSLATLVVVVCIFWASCLHFVERSPARLVGVLVFSALLLLSLQATFDLKREVLALLGRRPDLTNRTDLWALLFDVSDSPVLGAGFMSFWTGERMELIWTRLGTGVLQAHSGYIEQYLNLGYVGVAFIILLLAKGVLGARALARSDPQFAHLRLCFVAAAAMYNYTEASFYGVNNMWVLLLCGLIVVPPARCESPSDGAGQRPIRPMQFASATGRARTPPQ